jgi:shikimate kinase
MAVRAVFLVGFMASGKSRVGRELAQRLAWDFVDLDAQIEAREKRTIAQLFQERGEPGFRAAETSALRELLTVSPQRDHVVALGGGAFVQAINRELLRPWPTVFLETPIDELWQRSLIDHVERPLRRTAEQFAALYTERLPYYRQATITVVTSGRDPASLCAEIERNLQLGGNRNSDSSEIFPARSETGESQ